MPGANVVVGHFSTRCPVLPHALQGLEVVCVTSSVPGTERGADATAAAAADTALGPALEPDPGVGSTLDKAESLASRSLVLASSLRISAGLDTDPLFRAFDPAERSACSDGASQVKLILSP